MKAIWAFIQSEPAGLSEVIRQGILLAILFGLLSWTVEQQTAVLMFISVLLSWLTRRSVTPNSKL